MAKENSLDNILPQDCNGTVTKLFNISTTGLAVHNVTRDNLFNLLYFCAKGYESNEEDKYSEPVVWVGVYMAVASLVCLVCMGADLLLAGMLNERYQISSKFTSLNVTSMMVLTIVMKLTVDMTGSMPSNLDQMAKIGSIAFMCTIMAILNPSLASMNNKTLLANIIGLFIFIVTMVVNLFIEIGTGVIRNNDEAPKSHISTENGTWNVVPPKYSFDFANVAYFYIGTLILLLLISISTAINIPSFKKILEFKYQVRRQELASLEQKQQPARIIIQPATSVEEVTQHVTKYWIMAKTGSPQFVMASNLLSYTSLLLCVVGLCVYIAVLISLNKKNAYDKKLESDYKWSISAILWTQVVGNIIGIMLVAFRCIRSLRFTEGKYSEFADLFNLKQEKYWTQRLSEWKGTHIGMFQSVGIAHAMKNFGLNLLGGLQKVLVVLNRCLACLCICFLNLIIKVYDVLLRPPVVSAAGSNVDDDDLRKYVLQLDDKPPPSQQVLEKISKSMKYSIEQAKKKQNGNLLELLDRRSKDGFKGVESFDNIDPLPLYVKLNSWGVPVIILTCIAIAVPDIDKDQVKRLIESINDALSYTRDVEKSFNGAREYANIRKTAMALWYEVKSRGRWLGKPIKRGKCGNSPKEILTWFAKQEEPVLISKAVEPPPSNLKETTTTDVVHYMVDFPDKSIAAHMMHHITLSIASKYPDKIKSNEPFFELLCSMIADILVACFSNLPQVIKMKCHADKIEKREASVEAAVELLGRSTKIIETIEKCQLPNMDPEKMGSFDEWRLHLINQSSIP